MPRTADRQPSRLFGNIILAIATAFLALMVFAAITAIFWPAPAYAQTRVQMVPWAPSGQATLAVTTSSARVALPNSDPVLVVENTGASDTEFKLGTVAVTAATTDFRLSAGHTVVIGRGAFTYLSSITASGSSSLSITQGNGVPILSGGGGSGGGGGGAVSIADCANTVLGCLADTSATNTLFGQIKALVAAANAAPVPNAVTSTNGSTTITTGNTFQTLLAANSARKGCTIQNPADATETLYVSVGIVTGSATKAKSFQLAAGQPFSCGSGFNVITDNIAVTAVTTGHPFVETDQ